jgi:hypothetical protein
MRATLAVVGLVILLAVWAAYSRRARIEAWIWHFRHGTAILVGDYVVPVPANWYVDSEGEGIHVLIRVETNDHTPLKKLKLPATILFLPQRPMRDEGLKRVMALDADFLKKQGVDPPLQRTFSVGDETIYCMGGFRMPSPPGIFDFAQISWSCHSVGGLDLKMVGVGPDQDQVWDIISNIRKKRSVNQD